MAGSAADGESDSRASTSSLVSAYGEERVGLALEEVALTVKRAVGFPEAAPIVKAAPQAQREAGVPHGDYSWSIFSLGSRPGELPTARRGKDRGAFGFSLEQKAAMRQAIAAARIDLALFRLEGDCFSFPAPEEGFLVAAVSSSSDRPTACNNRQQQRRRRQQRQQRPQPVVAGVTVVVHMSVHMCACACASKREKTM